MLIMRALGQEDLVEVTTLIHDQVFDVTQIVFSNAEHSLVIPYQYRDRRRRTRARSAPVMKRYRYPICRGRLTVRSVESYSIDDPCGIGTYDFNEIVYRDEEQTIVVTSGFGLEIHIHVCDVDVEVEQSGEEIGEELSFF